MDEGWTYTLNGIGWRFVDMRVTYSMPSASEFFLRISCDAIPCTDDAIVAARAFAAKHFAIMQIGDFRRFTLEPQLPSEVVGRQMVFKFTGWVFKEAKDGTRSND